MVVQSGRLLRSSSRLGKLEGGAVGAAFLVSVRPLGCEAAGGLLRGFKPYARRAGKMLPKKGRNFRPISGKTFPKPGGRIAAIDEHGFTAVTAETL